MQLWEMAQAWNGENTDIQDDAGDFRTKGEELLMCADQLMALDQRLRALDIDVTRMVKLIKLDEMD